MNRLSFLFTFSLLLILICSCQKDCTKDQHLYSFRADKSLNLYEAEIPQETNTFNFEITNGTNLVFSYQFAASQCESVFDDEYYEFLYFEINPETEQFNLVDSALLNIKLIHVQSGAWFNEKSRIVEGSIKGIKKSANTWDIEGNFVLPLNLNSASKASKINTIFEFES